MTLLVIFIFVLLAASYGDLYAEAAKRELEIEALRSALDDMEQRLSQVETRTDFTVPAHRFLYLT